MQSSKSCVYRPSARAVLILYLSMSACTSWRPEKLTPQAVVERHPLSMRVTYRDSSSVVINNPQMQGDTIVGPDKKNAQVRVPLDSVLQTETRHGDAAKSVFAVLGVGAGLVAVALVAIVIHCNQTACFDMQR